jgi:hypothetical protein
VACEGEPVRVSVCHCLACQRRTGSVFAVQARFPHEKVTIEGASSEYVRIGDDGGRLVFRFCPSCAATVSYTIDQQPELIAVPVGAFADPTFPAPKVFVYGARRHPWVVMPEGCVEAL